jgi:hypothetical protein
VKLKLPDDAGNVIELSVVRDSMIARRMIQSCDHHRVSVDETLNEIKCLDCEEKLNPIGWIVMMAAEWARVQRLTTEYREARVAYEAKRRCRCEHCKKMTRVAPAGTAEIREFRRKPQEIER